MEIPKVITYNGYPILVAEDNPDDAELLKCALRQAGSTHPIQIVTDGRDAIRYLQADAPYSDRVRFPFPRLIFTDLKMPYLTGFDVLKWLRLHPDCHVIPVIVFSASAQESDLKEAYRLGANCYLVKPTGFEKTVEGTHIRS